MQVTNFERQDLKTSLLKILQSKKPEFVYVRGRRRIGKSWILKTLTKDHPGQCFYYMGGPDQTQDFSRKQFIEEWSSFTQDTSLLSLKSQFISWKSIFDHITAHVKKNKKPVTLIFDEIQWIAKEGSGFVGKLKEAWIDWEQLRLIKVIICGSSNKFFAEKTGGEEKILRGMKTQSDIVVGPITLSNGAKERFKKWSKHEISILWMLTGGVPYYLNQMDHTKPFLHAINDAFFTKTSIFLSEVDEILSLEFNKQGQQTVKKILAALGTYGSTEALIGKKTKISKSTLHLVLEKLVTYQLISPKKAFGKNQKSNDSGTKYIINDSYLNTYFQLMDPIKGRIQQNSKELIFQFSSQEYYIPEFTGPRFERLIEQVLQEKNFHLPLFDKLDLRTPDFEIETYWDKEQQIDLIINSHQDRISRAIEIKWQSLTQKQEEKIQQELSEKEYPLPPYYQRKNYVISLGSGNRTAKTSSQITVHDLFLTK
jgi:AAA+ ATPase superfamily predicted ATPase